RRFLDIAANTRWARCLKEGQSEDLAAAMIAAARSSKNSAAEIVGKPLEITEFLVPGGTFVEHPDVHLQIRFAGNDCLVEVARQSEIESMRNIGRKNSRVRLRHWIFRILDRLAVDQRARAHNRTQGLNAAVVPEVDGYHRVLRVGRLEANALDAEE